MPASLRLWLVLLMFSLPLAAQEAAPRALGTELPAAPAPSSAPTPSLAPVTSPAPVRTSALAPVPEHRFWDRTNILLFSGVAATRALDYNSTRHFQARGHEEALLPDDVVNNSAGFAALEAAGAATSVGISYILHRTGHHKLERWMSIGHICVGGFGDVRNYLLN